MKTSLKERVEDIMPILVFGSKEDVILSSHILHQRYVNKEVSADEIRYILDILLIPQWINIHPDLLSLYDSSIKYNSSFGDQEYWVKFDVYLADLLER